MDGGERKRSDGLEARIAELEAELRRRDRARERAEAELHELEAALADAIEGFGRMDRRGRFVSVNSAFADIFGYGHEEVVGLDWRSLAAPDSQAELVAAYAEMCRRGKAKREVRALRKDGAPMYAEVTLSVQLDRHRRPSGHHVFVKDLTRWKETEQALADHVAELARSNADLQHFACMASHDLQEPLRSVAGFTRLLQRRYRGQLGPEADEFIEHTVAGVGRMKQLIDDLLSYARAGSRGLERKTVCVQEALRWALENLAGAIAETGATVEHGPLPTVYADPVQLRQVLQNLIGNAIKFRGEGRPRVHLAVTESEDEWQVAVRDNGIGIPSEYANRLFRRLHGRDEYPGTGVGLAICKKVVERHGGRIWFESRPGAGTSFCFTLPKPGERTSHPRPPSTAPALQ